MTEAQGWTVTDCPNCHKVEMFHRYKDGWRCSNCRIMLDTLQDVLGGYYR